MFNKCRFILLALIFTMNIFVAADAVANCRWVGGHHRNGVWVPAHRVCWHGGARHCRWVGGWWRNGVHRGGHRVCWR